MVHGRCTPSSSPRRMASTIWIDLCLSGPHPMIEAMQLEWPTAVGALREVETLISSHLLKLVTVFSCAIFKSPSIAQRLLGAFETYSHFRQGIPKSAIIKDLPCPENRTCKKYRRHPTAYLLVFALCSNYPTPQNLERANNS